MSISVYTERPHNGGVRRRYQVTLTDNNAVEHTEIVGMYNTTPDDDGSQVEADILESKRLAEDRSFENLPDNPLDIVLNPQWSTTKRCAKAAIRWMMREQDPSIVVYLKPLIEYIQANYNATQIASLLDITSDQVLKMNRRVNAILTDTGTVETLLASFEAEQEDIE